ncbi:germination protein YpeB [Paenibacillus sp. y28]|uniref:germination protein YpeB n=1 Tax=Paenibacillus sp. y28 TaxID=3129110 RepID=UPI00301717D0
MYRRLSMVLFPIMTIALIGTVLWGYQVNQEKNTVLLKAENQYQRAFHDLSYHVEQLNGELGKALVASPASQDFQRRSLINAWRLTSEARSEISQLPLTLLPFNKTEEFLSNLSQFTYRASVRDLSQTPLAPEEIETMNSLFERSKEIASELRGVQDKVITNNLRWMDVESAMATEKSTADNVIIDGFTTVDKKVGEYSELNWGPSMASVFQKRSLQMLSGNDVTAEEVKEKAAKFAGISDPGTIQVAENAPGTEYSSFSATVTDPSTGREKSMDFSKKGGQLLWYMAPRDVTGNTLTVDQAKDNGHQFLADRGYPEMTAISYDEYNNVANIVYATKQDDVLLMTDKITLQIALDNGEVIQVQAVDFVHEHKPRNIEKPVMSAEQAREKLNKNFQIRSQQLALIKNDLDEEVLCYQYTGSMSDGNYRVYVNANNGFEEKVERL